MSKVEIKDEALIIILFIIMCIAPMAVNPSMTGIKTLYRYRNFYENLTESFVEGHIDLQYGAWDPKLFALENPYDSEARVEADVFFPWDHALFDNHYYMYFGVVPLLVLFLPFRMLFGTELFAFIATAIFSSLFIVGIFALFRLLKKELLPSAAERSRLLMSMAFSLAGMYYAMTVPIFYCTAITSALCVEVWSIYFFVKAVWGVTSEAESIRMAFWGALFGALAFGCRPTIAFANFLAVPMAIVYLRKRKKSFRFWLRMMFAVSPYVVVGIGLMYYNAIRFGNPFEFGQAYQLTVTDQTAYGNMLDNISWSVIAKSLLENYFDWKGLCRNFPYFQFSGAFINFPVFIFPFVGICFSDVRKQLKAKGILALTIVLLVLPVVITIMDAIWAPWLTERYRMDFYWLMGIAVYLVYGAWDESLSAKGRRIIRTFIGIMSVYTLMACVLLYSVANEELEMEKAPIWLIISIMAAMTIWLLNLCRLTGKVEDNE